MKLLVVAIGGAGEGVAQELLANEDIDWEILSKLTSAEHVSSWGLKGIWLEADRRDEVAKQKLFKDWWMNKEEYPVFYVPQDIVPKDHPIDKMVSDYGYDIKKAGYVRDAQYLKAVYEIFEFDGNIRMEAEKDLNYPSPIFEGTWSVISPYTTLGGGECDGILFIISFGGGTGSGFINPIVKYIRSTGRGDYPVFVLGILTEKGKDAEQLVDEPKRDLAAISAIYDLMTNPEGVDGIILIDNQILADKFHEVNYFRFDCYIKEILQPLVAARSYPGEDTTTPAIRTFLTEKLNPKLPPILVPCYSSRDKKLNNEAALVKEALGKGRLFNCEPNCSDRILVFCRGYLDSDKIKYEIKEELSRSLPESKKAIFNIDIEVRRKLAENRKEEMLILLRNPYDNPKIVYKKDGAFEAFDEGTLEGRIYGVINQAIQYIESNKLDLLRLKSSEEHEEAQKIDECEPKLIKKTRDALNKYFYGEPGLRFELEQAVIKLQKGDKPFFTRPLKIFDEYDKLSKSGGFKENEEKTDLPFTEEQINYIKKIIMENKSQGTYS